MTSTSKNKPSIGLVELPSTGVIDPAGRNWTALYRRKFLISKQVLIPSLQAGGFDPHMINLRNGEYREEFGHVEWKGMRMAKTYVGKSIYDVEPDAFEAWGLTVNFIQERQVARLAIRHLTSKGRPVVVGGSDAVSDPAYYLESGASAVVTDKSGGSNLVVMDKILGRTPRDELRGAVFADGTPTARLKGMLPEDWPLPEVKTAEECLGMEFTEEPFLEDFVPIGSIFADIGCDRRCDFCQTPTYGLGYRRMSPNRTLEWLSIQKEAGARITNIMSDQYMGRVLLGGGRQEILDTLQGARDMGMPFSWSNGLELSKLTIGGGLRNNLSEKHKPDLSPDEELVNAVYGWDGKKGCLYGYIPAERPVFGREVYAKLLPWQNHRQMMCSIVRAGLPIIVYGVILGFPDDSNESLQLLEDALIELHQELKEINPELDFQVACYALSPIPGTPQGMAIRESGLLQFQDTAILGGLWTPCANTNHITYEEISEWQFRLAKIGKDPSNKTNYHGGLTMLAND